MDRENKVNKSKMIITLYLLETESSWKAHHIVKQSVLENTDL